MEDEHVKSKPGPGKSVHHGSIERLFVRKHPGLLRQCKVQVVPLSEPEENVLQSGATSLVGFSKGNLQVLLSEKMKSRHWTVSWCSIPVSAEST